MTKRCRRGGDKGKSIYLRLDDLRCTIEVTLLKACFSDVRDRVIPIVHCQSSNRKFIHSCTVLNLMAFVIAISLFLRY